MDTVKQAISGENQVHVAYEACKLEEDKRAIYGHPLFPLLAVLLEKCEMATTSSKLVTKDFGTFEEDVQTFIEHNTKGNNRLFIQSNDITELMVHALQVLQIHVMELQKVRDLCNEFCTRYVSNMKSKLAPEKLIGVVSDDELSLSLQEELLERQSFDGGEMSNGGDYVVRGYHDGRFPQDCRPTSCSMPEQRFDSYSRSEDGYDDSPPLVIADSEQDLSKEGTILGRTDSDDSQTSQQPLKKKQSKGCRGALPKPATAMLKNWIWEHKDRPYPTEDEKRMLADRGNITVHQINNWFINARRRILQPHMPCHFRENPSCNLEACKTARDKRNTAALTNGKDENGAFYSRNGSGLSSRGFPMSKES